jgi:hypothetical protein
MRKSSVIEIHRLWYSKIPIYRTNDVYFQYRQTDRQTLNLFPTLSTIEHGCVFLRFLINFRHYYNFKYTQHYFFHLGHVNCKKIHYHFSNKTLKSTMQIIFYC